MRTVYRTVSLAAVLTLVGSPARAQTAPVVTDLMKDIAEVEGKLVSLAKAIPADKYGWRPSAGVRSIGEVVMHVAADNYFMPVGAGVAAAPAATGITGDYKTAAAYEKRAMKPEDAVKEMQASFAFLKQQMQATTAAKATASTKMFGMDMTGQQMWIMTTTHLHEHLGQMIAYARSNNVVPPWSK